MAGKRSSSSSAYLARGESWLESMTARLMVMAWRGLGVGLVALALMLALSFLSYHHGDPSWNTASAAAVQNWMGVGGAKLADLMLQTLGLGVMPLLAVLIIYGIMIIKMDEDLPHLLPLRVLYVVLAMGLAGMAAARIPSFGFLPAPYMGGSVGMMGLNLFSSPLQPYFGPWVHVPLAFILAAGSFVLLCLSAGLGPRAGLARLAAFTLMLVDGAQAAWAWAKNLYESYIHPDQAQEEAHKKRRPRRIVRSEEDEEDDADEDEDDFDEEDETEWVDEEDEDYPRRNPNDIKVVRPESETARARRKKSRQMELGEVAGDFALPPIDLLQEPPHVNNIDAIDEDALRKNADMLQTVLNDYHVRGDIMSIHPGPVVTLYELEPAPGTKSSRVIGLANDIARSMAALSVRAAVVPGRNVIGIEIPNKIRQTVYLRDLLSSDAYANTGANLGIVLGKDIGGHPVIADLARMPHLLVAGTTGSGKSVAINTMILSLLYRLTPEQCRFIMIDPKMLELSVYDDIPHLLSPVVTEPGRAVVALKWTVQEMENRYRAMSKLGVRNIEGYNTRLREARESGEELMRKVQTGFDPETGEPVYEEQPLDLKDLPYIVVVVDEFADLMLVAGKDVESAIQRLSQMARAAGIHLIMATQRPSVDVITGVIKANFPTRISFQVTSKIDSRTILGEGGAEQLLGQGDMLYMAAGGRITRVHGPFVSDAEVREVVEHLKAQGTPEYLDEVTEGDGLFGDDEEGGEGGNAIDEMYDQAVALVAREGKASTSFVQRHLQIGYNRAARIIEEMERQGVITAANHAGKREVLVGDHSGRH